MAPGNTWHHGWGQIHGDGSHGTADVGGERLCAGYGLSHLSSRRVSYHQRTLATMSLLVGQQGIYLSVAEAGLVKTQVRADVFQKENVLVSVFQLIPLPIAADGFLVLFAQGLTVQSVTGGQCGNAYRGAQSPYFKKATNSVFKRVLSNPDKSHP